MMFVVGSLIIVLCAVLAHGNVHHKHKKDTQDYTAFPPVTYDYADSVMDIDDKIQYGYILPYINEWEQFWGEKNKTYMLSPFQFWFKCYENEVRGYFFFEDLRVQNHGKEADISDFGHVGRNVKLTADGVPVKIFRMWHGGGDFFFDIPPGTPRDHNIDIEMKGFKHYTRFKVSNCEKKKPVSPVTKYVMHIHLRDFSKISSFRPGVIDGVANHMAYHRCAFKLDKYEVVIQKEHLNAYLQNEKIAHAVKQGWITFLIRNPVIPTPLHDKSGPSNCYYQAYVQNMAILQHWQENVKMYFWDSDEYVATHPDLKPTELMQMVESGTAVGFMRKMIFCTGCDKDKPEVATMSITKTELALNSHVLMHPKLVVDPNRVGCYIVHWAGCGDETKELPIEKAYILHFEDLYHRRWDINHRKHLGNETVFQPTAIQKTCDPTLYDWKGPLPSFHA